MDPVDELNSSDIDYEEPTNPYPAAGEASTEVLLQRAVEYRLESKKQVKQMAFVSSSKKTQYLSYLWYNRFNKVKVEIFKVAKESVPTAEQLERFLRIIVDGVRPQMSDTPSFSWLQGGLQRLVVSIIFFHKGFTLDKHDRLRLASTINDLHHQGKITKVPKYHKNWLGSFFTRKLAYGLLVDALKNGTLFWTNVMARVLSMVITAATGARAGDLTRSSEDTQELPFLCYGDITLKLSGGNTLDHLIAQVNIRNQKGHKSDGRVRKVQFKALTDPVDNPIDPIKLLLIMALRLGNIQGQTVDEVLQLTAAHHDKTVQWLHPKRPVLCKFDGGSGRVLKEEPASNRQLTNILAEAGPKAGLLSKTRSHDFRRGFFQDNANLPEGITGHASAAVAQIGGHSVRSHARGLTALYSGDITQDTWSKRVANDFVDDFGLATAEQPYKKQESQSQAFRS